MSINLDQIAEVRIQVLNSFENILDIEDVIFISSVNNGKHNFEQGIVPYENLRSITDKYFARKQVVRLIENKTLNKVLVHSDQAFFFSFDVVYNVDYCFHFNFNKNTNHLIVFRKNGEIIFSEEYYEEFDERPYLFSEVIEKESYQNEPKSQNWNNIKVLNHITDISNLESILKKGILSHTISHSLNITQKDISNKIVNSRRKKIHNKVPFYFTPLNPMTYVLKNESNLIIIQVDKKILLTNGVIFTDGNAASNNTKFFTSIKQLDNLDWNCINDTYWTDYSDGKRKRCAEVLVPHKVPSCLIKTILCNSDETFALVKKITTGYDIKIEVNKQYFF
ncbi:DUF4433 domain-containing protein [Tenacibaculum finnmarkense genomovar ulcerans]|uniref:DUF4433 domain-containing protein n=1 Tax=Tenacibaculum finnmarkense TaxID=2781243 RepID=UPI001E510464|nr:DUF4433 domain-containing protein [Tenacibaculum finnmarkense]MCD8455206.1 DUF4433 domain-containing protein [Tenacibaculum finnmarkense genomovar ulcerans]